MIVSPPQLPTNHSITSLHYPISSTRVDLINPGQSEVLVSEALHRRKLHLSSNKNIRYSPYTAGSGYSPEERWKEDVSETGHRSVLSVEEIMFYQSMEFIIDQSKAACESFYRAIKILITKTTKENSSLNTMLLDNKHPAPHRLTYTEPSTSPNHREGQTGTTPRQNTHLQNNFKFCFKEHKRIKCLKTSPKPAQSI